MPPSPSLRRFPAKEISHKRGHSFGSTLPAKLKDDELKLFNDMQKNERENFLLESSDNFDESISKLSYFPDFNLGVNIARRGESRDFLNVDGDKNDYDWLLTPPETPLFRSLDDEEDQRIGLSPRGRAQTKPISISRSSTMENTQRSSRSSASPSRLSTSPRSSSSAALARTRSSNSSSRCSPPLALQSSTASRRSSTTLTAKTLTPPRRSPSPASRRMSAGPSGPTLNGTRGASPVKANRRSSSPKLQGWQSSDPGFSFDAPPNLRTSLPDRPVSRSRGGSPSSFSGLDMGSRGRRQSMSPTPSRRASSSHSNERDRFSSYSKASVTSSGDDDLDSLQSVPVAYSSSPAVKKSLAVMKNRTIASSKKPSKSFSPSSAPKRSFDSAVWLMDHRKAQDMFRPLLSSVPTTTFGAGKGSNVYRPMFSHNSSVTTSSNASSEHRATFGPCMDTDQERHDLSGEWEATASSEICEDIFKFDKLDELNEGPSCHQRSLSPTRSGPENSLSTEIYVKSSSQDLDMEGSRTASQTSCDVASISEAGHGKMATCTMCRKLLNMMDVDGGDYCEECALRDGVLSADPKIQIIEEPHQQDHKITNSKPYVPSEHHLIAPGCAKDSSEASLDHRPVINKPPACYLQRCPIQSTEDTNDEMLLGQHLKNLAENIRLLDTGDSSMGNNNDISSHRCNVSDCQQAESTSVVEYDLFRDQKGNHNHGMPECLSESDCQGNEFVSDIRTSDSHQLQSTGSPRIKAENTEGTGISVLLLQNSSSNKWPVVEGRPLAATNILCLEPYYVRDNINMMKRSIGMDSSSAASSVDPESSRQSDVRFERLKSGKRCDFEKSQISSTMSHQSVASVSDMSISGSSSSLCPQSDVNGYDCYTIGTSENSASRTVVSTGEHDRSCKDALSSAIECWSAVQAIVHDDSEAVGDVVIHYPSADCIAHDDDLSVNMCSSCTEMPSNIPQSSAAYRSCSQKIEDTSAITNYSIDTPEHPCDENNFGNLQMQSETALASDEANRLDDCSVSAISEEDVLVSATEAKIVELPNDEGSRKQIERCFTLEEATDTILFCSSIVHDLAYKAATIGLEHEQESELAGAPRPTVTILGKSLQREDGLLKLPHRKTPKRKVKKERLEGETISETSETEVIIKDPVPVRSASEITRTSDSMKPPKMESKCNCTIM